MRSARPQHRKKWTKCETQALVQFVALHKDLQPTESVWPAMTVKHDYWEAAAQYIAATAKTDKRKCKLSTRS